MDSISTGSEFPMSRWNSALSATAAWLIFLLIAVACGAARETLLVSRVGPFAAHILGTLAVVALIGLAIYGYVRVAHASTVSKAVLLVIGVYWLILTMIFEIFFGHYVMGDPGQCYWPIMT